MCHPNQRALSIMIILVTRQSSKVKKITRCCTVLPVLRVINNSRWWKRPLTSQFLLESTVRNNRGWCCHNSRLKSLIKSQIDVTVRIFKSGCYQQLIQDSFQCHNRESRRLFHSYILSQERDGVYICFLNRS